MCSVWLSLGVSVLLCGVPLRVDANWETVACLAEFSMSEAAGGTGTILTFCVFCRNLIEPDQCTYTFTASRIDVCLKKRHSQRWGGLEAPATRGLHPAFFLC